MSPRPRTWWGWRKCFFYLVCIRGVWRGSVCLSSWVCTWTMASHRRSTTEHPFGKHSRVSTSSGSLGRRLAAPLAAYLSIHYVFQKTVWWLTHVWKTAFFPHIHFIFQILKQKNKKKAWSAAGGSIPVSTQFLVLVRIWIQVLIPTRNWGTEKGLNRK